MPGFNRYAVVFRYLEAIGKRNDNEFRAEQCHAISKGRTTSLKELTDFELFELKEHLRRVSSVKNDASDFNTPEHESDDKMRKKILSICHEMGWNKPGGEIDWERLNNYLRKYGYKHKPLNSYKHNELPTLVSQFEELLKSFYEKNTTETKI